MIAVHVVEHSIVRSIRDVVPTFATSVPILSRHSRKRPIFVQDPKMTASGGLVYVGLIL